MTDTVIPDEVIYLLQLGEKFNLPTTKINKRKFINEIIKQIEHNISRTEVDMRNDIRNKTIPILSKFYEKDTLHNLAEKMLLSWLKTTDLFVKNNPHILFTRADKGNTTVILYKNDYF